LVVEALAYQTYNNLASIQLKHNLVDMVLDTSRLFVELVSLGFQMALEEVVRSLVLIGRWLILHLNRNQVRDHCQNRNRNLQNLR